MAEGKIEYDILTPWTITPFFILGPTKDTTIRPNSALPNTASSSGVDPTTAYLDPGGGDDANSGLTFALAKKTWAAAAAIGRTTLHIQNSLGTESSMSVTLTDELGTLLPNGLRFIQVAAGQLAKLTISGIGFYILTPVLQDAVINGLELIGESTVSGPIRAVNTNIRFEWCQIEGINNPLDTDGALLVSMVLEVSSCIIIAKGSSPFAIKSQVRNNLKVEHSALVNLGTAVTGMQINPQATLDWRNCVILGFENVYDIASASPVTITAMQSHIFHRCVNIVQQPALQVIPLLGCFMNVESTLGADVSDPENTLNGGDPLFQNEVGLNFRLMHVGEDASPGVKYPITSPAVGAGRSGVDAGAFIVTRVQGAEEQNTLTYDPNFGFDKVEVTLVRSNYQGFNDIQGRFHNTWDDVQYEVKFKLKRKDFTGNDFSYNLATAFRSKGFKRFYPYGDDGLFSALIACTVIDATNIDFTTNLPDVTKVDGSGAVQEDLGVNAFTGWVVQIDWTDSGAKSGFFEILSNTATALELKHIRGDSDITSGSDFSANILYLPVQLAMKSLDLDSEYYSESDNTGTGNDDNKPWLRRGFESSEDMQNAEFHTRTWILRQTREEPN